MSDPVLEFIWTLIPKGKNGNEHEITAAISPHALRGAGDASLQQALTRWRDFVAAGVPPINLTFCGSGSVTAAFKEIDKFDGHLWDTFFAGVPLVNCFEDRRKPSKRRVRRNYAAAVSETQSLRHSLHFDEHAQKFLPQSSAAQSQASAAQPNSRLGDLRFLTAAERENESVASEFSAQAAPTDNTEAHVVLLRALGGATNRLKSRPGQIAQSLTDKEKQREQDLRRGAAIQSSGDFAAQAVDAADDISEEEAMLGLLAFHGRLARETNPSQASASEAAADCPIGFHERIALLNGYPSLLRRLGLVLDFAFTTNVAIDRIAVSDSPFATSIEGIAHKSACTIVGPVFRPRVQTGALTPEGAALPLSEKRFVAEMTDIDGTAIKYLNHVNQPTQAGDLGTDGVAVPPSRRSAGISILDKIRGDELLRRVNRHDGITDASGTELHAEDLCRGFLVDVRRDGETVWTSLTKRNEIYDIGPDKDHAKHFVIDGQHGLVRLTAARPTDLVAQARPGFDDLHVAETIFRWDGWSLAVPPVGTPIENVTQASEQPLPWILETNHEVPCGHLIPLRFGHCYEFRARAADLVGEPLGVETNREHITRAITYRRFDPVAPPMVLLAEPLQLGQRPSETLHRLVLPTPTRGFSTESVTRCFIPPMTTYRMAEQHGVYDSLTEKQSPRDLGGYQEVLLGRTKEGCFGFPTWSPDGKQQIPIAQPPESKERRHYLPDPLAKCICVRIEDLVTGEEIELPPHPWYGQHSAWPNAKLLRIRLQGRADGRARVGAEWLHDPDTLAIALPAAWVARVRISCGMEHSDLPLLGALAEWERNASECKPQIVPLRDDETKKKVHERVACGCHEMVSPSQELMLIHPVTTPLLDPVIERMLVIREKETALAKFDTRLLVDRKSTGRVKVDAEWEDCHDDPALPAPDMHQKHKATIAKSQVSPVTGKEESVPEITIDSPEAAADYGAQEPNAIDETLVHAFDDTRAYVVSYKATAFTRFEHDLPPGTNIEKRSRASKVIEVAVPSSARPPEPAIRCIIPTFQWERKTDRFHLEPHARFESARRSGLRVLLERPWCVSGKGEMLGVVLWPALGGTQAEALNSRRPAAMLPAAEIPEKLQPLVTRWGMDPIWNAAPTSLAPTANHFPNATFATNLSLPELPHDERVTVAAYTPQFDQYRNAWYCDIAVERVPSYWPFLRLALVRYQPLSQSGFELSPVRLADFVQIVPDRAATVMRMPEDKQALFVEIHGQDGGKACELEGNEIDVTVERRCEAESGGFAWVPDVHYAVERTKGSRDALWSGLLRLKSGTGARRILIRESERFVSDGPAWDASKTQNRTRLIYADVLEI